MTGRTELTLYYPSRKSSHYLFSDLSRRTPKPLVPMVGITSLHLKMFPKVRPAIHAGFRARSPDNNSVMIEAMVQCMYMLIPVY